MTREEAITVLERLSDNTLLGYQHKAAFNIAIHDIKQLADWLKELKQLREQTKWIPVSERLPEECWSVLVYCPTNNNTFCAYIERGEWKIFSPIANEKINEVVTAWMPLPEPYVPDTNIGEMSENPTGSDDELYSDCIDAFKKYALGRK